MFHDSVRSFNATARLAELEIKRRGIRSDSYEPVPNGDGLTHHDAWAAWKNVSHFNLGTALELLLKLLLFLNKAEIPKGPEGHQLVKLYGRIPPKYQAQLNDVFQAVIKDLLPEGGIQLRAYINAASPDTHVGTPPNRDISSLMGFFEYLDEDVRLWQKRYSWELVDAGQFRHYLSDIEIFVELINRVMADLPRNP